MSSSNNEILELVQTPDLMIHVNMVYISFFYKLGMYLKSLILIQSLGFSVVINHRHRHCCLPCVAIVSDACSLSEFIDHGCPCPRQSCNLVPNTYSIT